MLDKHEKAIYKDIYPRLENVEKIQAEYALQSEALKNQVEKVSLSNQDVKNTIKEMGIKQDGQFNRMFDHILQVNTTQQEVNGQLKITNANADKEVKIAKLSLKEKVILGILTAPSIINFLLSWGEKLQKFFTPGG